MKRCGAVLLAGLAIVACGEPLKLTDLARWDEATSDARRAAAERVDERFDDFTLDRMETFSGGGQEHEIAVFVHLPTGLEFSLVPVPANPAAVRTLKSLNLWRMSISRGTTSTAAGSTRRCWSRPMTAGWLRTGRW